MRVSIALLFCFGLLACAPPDGDTAAANAPKPNSSEGIHYHAVSGGAVLRCNSWGFETICKASGSR